MYFFALRLTYFSWLNTVLLSKDLLLLQRASTSSFPSCTAPEVEGGEDQWQQQPWGLHHGAAGKGEKRY